MQTPTQGAKKGAILLMALAGLLAVVIIACGSPSDTPSQGSQEPASSTGAASGASEAPQPTATVAIAAPTPTAMPAAPAGSGGAAAPAPTAAPQPAVEAPAPVSSRDSITVVTSGEPVNMDIHSDECSGNIDHMVCQELTVDPFTWIDGTTFEVQGLTGIDRWEQVAPDRWRFFLRPGITFHNGEPWNADAAKFGIDKNGTGLNGGGFSQHSFVEGEVVDDLTVDVLCQDAARETRACPIFPRQAMFAKFAAPAWYQSASEEERARTVVSNGPYKFVSWESGVDITVEAYEDYQPKDGVFATTYPAINTVRQLWRSEAFVRAGMVSTGEADWADNIGFENAEVVPQAIQSGTNEIYTLVADNIWHPELKKKEVRMALAHAIDCQAIVESLYDGRNECFGNISQPGTLGITEENSKPYAYDPDMSRRLLEEAGYDPENEIRIHTRSGRVYRDVELHEAVVGYWKEVGVTASVQVLENAQATNHRRAGCGKFNGQEGYAEAMDCAERGPAPPINATTHYYETATSNEQLDFARQGTLRLSCFNVNSRVCYPDLEEQIRVAQETPLGDLRRERMEAIAQRAHDEYWFIPFFHVQAVYGLAEDLVWTPRYDPRIRVSTMYFK